MGAPLFLALVEGKTMRHFQTEKKGRKNLGHAHAQNLGSRPFRVGLSTIIFLRKALLRMEGVKESFFFFSLFIWKEKAYA